MPTTIPIRVSRPDRDDGLVSFCRAMLGFYAVLALVLMSITGIEMHFGMYPSDIFASAFHIVRNGCRGFDNGFGLSRAVRSRLGTLGEVRHVWGNVRFSRACGAVGCACGIGRGRVNPDYAEGREIL